VKIVCESTNEFMRLMRACEYLHDLELDMDKHPILNDIRHLYLGEDDLPNKKSFISIKGRKDLPRRTRTLWNTVKRSKPKA
jgi:hypothetical protein